MAERGSIDWLNGILGQPGFDPYSEEGQALLNNLPRDSAAFKQIMLMQQRQNELTPGSAAGWQNQTVAGPNDAQNTAIANDRWNALNRDSQRFEDSERNSELGMQKAFLTGVLGGAAGGYFGGAGAGVSDLGGGLTVDGFGNVVGGTGTNTGGSLLSGGWPDAVPSWAQPTAGGVADTGFGAGTVPDMAGAGVTAPSGPGPWANTPAYPDYASQLVGGGVDYGKLGAELAASGWTGAGGLAALSPTALSLLKDLPTGSIPAALSAASGLYGAGAARSAAGSQTNAANNAIALQRENLAQTRADNAPFLATGTAANARLRQLLGIDPNYTGADSGSLTRNFTSADLEADPVYKNGLQFGLDQGTQAINNRAMQAGNYDSGATLKALTRFGNDYGTTKAADAYSRFTNNQGNTYNKLAGVSGAGQVAVGTGANAGANTTNAVSDLTTGIGNANAAGTVGAANAYGNAANGVNTAFSNATNSQILDALLKKGNYGSVYG